MNDNDHDPDNDHDHNKNKSNVNRTTPREKNLTSLKFRACCGEVLGGIGGIFG